MLFTIYCTAAFFFSACVRELVLYICPDSANGKVAQKIGHILVLLEFLQHGQ